MSVSYVCFIATRTTCNEAVEASEIEHLSAGQIMSKYATTHLKGAVGLGVRIDNYMRPIDEDTRVLEVFPGLVLETKPCECENMYVGLVCIEDRSFLSQLMLYFDVKAEFPTGSQPVIIPQFGVIFDQETTYHVSKMIKECQVAFDIDNVPGNIMVNEIIIDGNVTVAELAQQGRRLTFACSITPAGVAKITEREHSASELLKTEQTFVEKLDVLSEYWEPVIKHKKLFSWDDMSPMFRDANTLRVVHRKFLDELKERIKGYHSCVAEIVERYRPWVKMFCDFIARSQLVANCIQAIQNDSEKYEILQSLWYKPTDADSSDHSFFSYVIQPMQRVARYPLLMQKLAESTPKSHPEASLLRVIWKRTVESAEGVNDYADQFQKYETMRQLQNKLVSHQHIISPGRGAVFMTYVRIMGRKPMKTELHVFTDSICILEMHKNRYRMLTEAPIEQFHCVERQKLCITVPALAFVNKKERKQCDYLKNTEFDVIFPDVEQYRGFVNAWRGAKEKLITNRHDHLPHLLWKRHATKSLFDPLYNHAVVQSQSEEMMNFFGGVSADKRDSDIFRRMDPNSYVTSSVIETKEGVSKCTVLVVDKIAYVLGGKTKGKLNKHLTCIGLDNGHVWKPTTIGKMEPRTGHTTVFYDHCLWTFGGKQGNNYKNDVVVLHVAISKFDTPTISNSSLLPPERHGHSACVSGSMMYIFGGCQKHKPQILNDLWCFDMSTSQWKKIALTGDYVSPRYHHFVTIHEGVMIVFGGITAGRNSGWSAIDLESGRACCFGNAGDVPVNLKGACALRHSDGTFRVIGGKDNMKQVSAAIYDVKIVHKDRLTHKKMTEVTPERVAPRHRHGTIHDSLYQLLGITHSVSIQDQCDVAMRSTNSLGY